ncbi:MAG: uroporphyrinogen-III synthase [Hyphococcus sp.]
MQPTGDNGVSGRKTVIITRPEPEASVFASACAVAGLRSILSPLISITILDAPPDLAGVGALAFTSANGVRAFAHNSPERALPVYAVGGITAEAAQSAGFAHIVPASGDVRSLAALIADNKSAIDGDVLHVAGDHRAGDLAGALTVNGVRVRMAQLYEACAAPALSRDALAALRSADEDCWVVLFSPRTARLFRERLAQAGVRDLSGVGAACLSSAVAEAAGDGWARVALAPRRDADAMLELIAAA